MLIYKRIFMKKLFFGLTFLIVSVIVGIYWILFTSFGNSFVASLIEKKVNEGQTQVNLKVEEFKLSTSRITSYNVCYTKLLRYTCKTGQQERIVVFGECEQLIARL